MAGTRSSESLVSCARQVKRAVVLDFTTKADTALEKMKGQCSEMRARVEAECLELEVLTRKLQNKLIMEIDAQVCRILGPSSAHFFFAWAAASSCMGENVSCLSFFSPARGCVA